MLEAMAELYPGVLVGSYPSFDESGSEVEVVVKSADADGCSPPRSPGSSLRLDEATG